MRRLVANLIRYYAQHTPPHPGRGLLARLAWTIYPHPVDFEIAPGVRLRLAMGDADDIDYLTRSFERHAELELFLSFVKPGMTVLDVGANLGMYSLTAAKRVGPSGRVFAFEPVPATYQRLCEHIRLNALDNVRPCRLAVSDGQGRATLNVADRSASSSLFHQVDQGTIDVATESLDSFVRREALATVDAVKIDVEGAELHVVRGMRGLLEGGQRPVLQMEFNASALAAAGSDPDELYASLARHGYQGHLMRRGKLVPISGPPAEHTYGGPFPYSNCLFLPAGR
jgi:FkbM family methyltransferase